MQKTKWGKQIDRYTNTELGGAGLYTVDVGWAGIYFHFGALGTLGLILIFIHSIKKSWIQNKRWLSAWLMLIAITSFASGQILYYYQITSISMILYLIYGKDRHYNIGIQ